MHKLRNSSKGGYKHKLSQLRVWHSTAELPRSISVENNNVQDGSMKTT